jgi:3-methyladenine DNA glycosylase AlkD
LVPEVTWSSDLPPAITARHVVKKLESLSSPAEAEKVRRFFRGNDDAKAAETKIMGVAFGKVFAVAKEFMQVPPAEIEKLLESRFYEARMAGVSIMDFQARAKSTTPARRKALFDLYVKRHDRINNWDLVDRAAPHVVGRYLMDQPRDVLYRLARSRKPCERRTAIVSTYYFIRAGEVADTFRIAELLLDDENDLVQKATGSWLREAGKKQRNTLLRFLETHGPKMPRTTLRYATEKLDKKLRARFLTMKPAD